MKSARKARSAVVLALLLCIAVPRGWAWGREGHRLTALVAEHFLSEAARIQIAELLRRESHGESLVDVAAWADEYRDSHPETAPWHFVDIPGSAATFDRDRDCPHSAADPQSRGATASPTEFCTSKAGSATSPSAHPTVPSR